MEMQSNYTLIGVGVKKKNRAHTQNRTKEAQAKPYK